LCSSDAHPDAIRPREPDIHHYRKELGTESELSQHSLAYFTSGDPSASPLSAAFFLALCKGVSKLL